MADERIDEIIKRLDELEAEVAELKKRTGGLVVLGGGVGHMGCMGGGSGGGSPPGDCKNGREGFTVKEWDAKAGEYFTPKHFKDEKGGK